MQFYTAGPASLCIPGSQERLYWKPSAWLPVYALDCLQRITSNIPRQRASEIVHLTQTCREDVFGSDSPVTGYIRGEEQRDCMADFLKG